MHSARVLRPRHKMRTHIRELADIPVLVDGRRAVVILDLRVQAGGAAAAASLRSYHPNVIVRITEFP